MSGAVQVAVPVPVDRLFSYAVPAGIKSPAFGTRVVVPLGRRTVTGVVVGFDDPPAHVEAIKPISRVLDDEPLIDEAYLELARWVSASYLTSIGEVLSVMLPTGKRAKELPAAGGDEPAVAPERLSLSEEQSQAVSAIRAAALEDLEESRLLYVYGITGSGKTEVFLRAAEEVLAAGRSVIYLVPEIALTHQLFSHIRLRFGDVAAMLHSGLTDSQRLGEWLRVRRGDARLVVGARSAVFAPVRRLGLVIIDEEHEGSYKAGNAPRYHARQVAMRRASTAQGACVLGSATPSVEAWHLMEQGTIRRLRLTKRLSGGALPRIRVQNLRGVPELISPLLAERLRATLAAGAQSILFINRRGFAQLFQCRSCGHEAECPNCSVPMTWHKQRGKLLCHYCGREQRPPSVCPACGSLDVGYTGYGTERIEEDLRRVLPEARVARLDTDATARRGVLRETLDEFAAGRIDVLVGTQMVAKGLNFPRVRTVGIVMADTGLSMPDFRSAERTFSLIVQVAGRAGRFRPDGEVIVQSVRPEHAAIRHAVEYEIDAFYHEEIAVRRELAFPPFSRLLRLVVRAVDRSAAQSAVDGLAERITAVAGEESGVELLGPAPAPLERINKSWRFQLILRGAAAKQLTTVARAALHEWNVPARVFIEVDVDPVNLM